MRLDWSMLFPVRVFRIVGQFSRRLALAAIAATVAAVA
jgi:hypothetical protein